jgi:RNA polymerase sigma-70 factor, ECF subfamily
VTSRHAIIRAVLAEAVEREAKHALAAGDVKAATDVVLRGYGPEILGYFAAVLHDVEAGRELYADWSAQVFCDLGGFRGDASIRTWLYHLAATRLSRHFRDPFRKRKSELASGHEAAHVDRSQTPVYQRTDVKDRFRALRAELTPDERALLVLRVDRDLSWREVAEILGEKEEAALRKRFERLRKRLRELAVAQGIIAGE